MLRVNNVYVYNVHMRATKWANTCICIPYKRVDMHAPFAEKEVFILDDNDSSHCCSWNWICVSCKRGYRSTTALPSVGVGGLRVTIKQRLTTTGRARRQYLTTMNGTKQ